ncbi:MAG: VWA domain-containing protein [Phycisphaerales bacterium]|nr:MAG: VWA domain-containing protein [Phycisphaerales bacterium]
MSLYGLHSPLFLIALVILVPMIWHTMRSRYHSRLAFSSTRHAEAAPTSWITRLRMLPAVLRWLAVAALCVGLARPQKGDEQTRVFAEGIAIQMVVDISSSMETLDFEFDGKPANRLEAVKRVFRNFVRGTDELSGRDDDLIGMVTFARYAESACPLTLDHDNLIKILDRVEIVRFRDDDGTAVGDGMGLGLERLRSLASKETGAGQPIKSKIMILLSDGSQNVPDSLDPVEVAKVAADLGIEIYTIGAGKPGIGIMPVRDEQGRVLGHQRVRSDLDEPTLKKVAEITGARYFRAQDTASLKNIYEEIDQLEKTKTEERRFMQYKELYPYLLWPALVLIGLEVCLVNTRFRSIP